MYTIATPKMTYGFASSAEGNPRATGAVLNTRSAVTGDRDTKHEHESAEVYLAGSCVQPWTPSSGWSFSTCSNTPLSRRWPRSPTVRRHHQATSADGGC